MLHADFRKNLIRIHLLYHGCNDEGLEPAVITPEIKGHGYKTNEKEINEQLEHLHLEGYLIKTGDIYIITDEGKKEFSELKKRINELCKEIN